MDAKYAMEPTMIKEEDFAIGDLVRYTGHGHSEYRSQRMIGIIIQSHQFAEQCKVSWVSKPETTGCWYWKSNLKKINKIT
jgi:hypothetical protein